MNEMTIINHITDGYIARCNATADEICSHGPMTARRVCDILIARRVEHDVDVTNLLASIVRGINTADVSIDERAYLDIAADVIGEAMAEIVNRYRKTKGA